MSKTKTSARFFPICQKNMCNKKKSPTLLVKKGEGILALPKQSLLFLIKLYQRYISPFLGQNCKHYPSCSHYANEALKTHGLIKGSILLSARIVRCNPWSLGGFDPVPNKVSYLNPRSFKISGNYQTQLYK